MVFKLIVCNSILHITLKCIKNFNCKILKNFKLFKMKFLKSAIIKINILGIYICNLNHHNDKVIYTKLNSYDCVNIIIIQIK